MDYVLIGTIINSFGIKGEVKVRSYSDFEDDRYKKDSVVYIGENHLKLTVDSFRHHKGFTLLKFKEFDNINQILSLINQNIYKSANDIPKLEDGHYFMSQIIGLDIYQNNHLVGKCIDFDEGIKYNFMRIKKIDNKEILVPFISAFVDNVDLDNNKLSLKDIEGLI